MKQAKFGKSTDGLEIEKERVIKNVRSPSDSADTVSRRVIFLFFFQTDDRLRQYLAESIAR